MRYMQCKCGYKRAWTSLGRPAACNTCFRCGSTLEEGPWHREPEEHEWEVYYRGGSEPNPDMVCKKCNEHKSIWDKRREEFEKNEKKLFEQEPSAPLPI